MTDTTELVARLRDQQDMIQLGEDAYEAADAIERLTRERDEARGGREVRHRAWLEAKARIVKLEAALSQSAEWFQQYADSHTAKGDTDKAKRNQDRADAAIRALKEPT
jgi:hypothetical protein